MIVTISNFEKFNPRKDVNSASWFRLEHSLFENPDFFDFTHIEKMVWIYLLCMASKKSSGTILLSWPHIERIGGFRKSDFLSGIEKLKQIQCVTVDVTPTSRARNADVTPTCSTNERTNETNEHDQKRPSVADFELIYEKYPRKEGKQKGMAIVKREVKDVETLALLEKAIGRYSNHCRSKRLEPKFIKQFATFMGSWRDWLEPDSGNIKFTRPEPVVKEPTFSQPPVDDTPRSEEEIKQRRAMFERIRAQVGLKI